MTITRACSSAKRGESHPTGRQKRIEVPERARAIQRTMVERLESLLSSKTESCLSESFTSSWEGILSQLEAYQRAIIDASGLTVSCTKGCSVCCCHWVEDVKSFEAEILIEYLRKNHDRRIPRIIEKCRSDNNRFERLSAIVNQKLAAIKSTLRQKIDVTDLLLASFYQLRIECPLLDNGNCMIYRVRPMTCRMYVSFSDPAQCNPERINKGRTPTYLFDPEEKIDCLIERLHATYIKSGKDTGLRSLLARYLS
jgi:Fe-S-cluster containining protein